MDFKEQISLAIYGIVVGVRDTLTLPTHSTITQTFIYSCVLFVCSLLSHLLGFYTFISWGGALLCSVLLGILLFIERSENDALSKMYRAAAVSAKQAMRRATNAGSGGRSQRNTADAGKRKKSSQQ